MANKREKIKIGNREVNGYLSTFSGQSKVHIPRGVVDQMQLLPGDRIVFVYNEKTGGCDLYKARIEIS